MGYTMGQHRVFLSARNILRLIYPEGLENKSIVDLGCLEGGYAVEFARLGMNVTGIEVRQSNYENCLYVKKHVNLPNLNFFRDDANNVAAYGKFDVFFINGLLYHLDKPRRFLEQVAGLCKKAIFLHTHVATVGESQSVQVHNLSEPSENEGLPGRWYPEHGEITLSDLEQLKWSAWSNARSFWIRKEYLVQLIKTVGFDMVFEQFDWMNDIAAWMTEGYYRTHDRIMLVGIKSEPTSMQRPHEGNTGI
jgi:SAM-dependent methyltransferase